VAVDRARAGGGVTLVELVTYRRKGHAEHDNQSYVPKGEIERWERENDPIDRYQKRLLSEFGLGPKELAQMDERVRSEVDRATDEAEKSPFPDALDALEGVYGEPPREKPLWFREAGSVVEAHERPEGWGTFPSKTSP
jgi:TPP-dependent pyruvate/acetoin dehydrogenase alpha subunit